MIVVDQAIAGYRVVLGCIACQTRIDGGEAPALAALVELAEAHVREAHPVEHEITMMSDGHRTFLRPDGTMRTEPWPWQTAR